MKMTYAQQLEFTRLVYTKLEEAAQMFGLEALYNVDVRFNVRGQVGGRAGKRSTGELYLEFNPEAVAKYWDDMVKNTIPHEVAHLVCFANPKLGRNHNRGWQAICRRLGGSSNRCHSYVLEKAKKVRQFLYCNEQGNQQIFKTTRHNKMQKAMVAYSVKGKGRFDKNDYIKEIKS